MRLARGTAILASACVLAAGVLTGCGTSARDQVQAKVQQFVEAIAARNYGALCHQVLAPVLLARLSAGGISCEQAMRIGLGNVRNPSISIGRITIEGSRATVITLSGASGEHGALESIGLVKTSAGWRISALAAPVLTGSPGSGH